MQNELNYLKLISITQRIYHLKAHSHNEIHDITEIQFTFMNFSSIV